MIFTVHHLYAFQFFFSLLTDLKNQPAIDKIIKIQTNCGTIINYLPPAAQPLANLAPLSKSEYEADKNRIKKNKNIFSLPLSLATFLSPSSIVERGKVILKEFMEKPLK